MILIKIIIKLEINTRIITKLAILHLQCMLFILYIYKIIDIKVFKDEKIYS